MSNQEPLVDLENKALSYLEAKNHYENLLSAFKWCVGLISIPISVLFIFFGSSYNSALEQAEKISEEADSRFDALDTKYIARLDELGDEYERKLIFMLQQSRQEAKYAALQSVREELQRPYIQGFIRDNVEKEIREDLDLLAANSFIEAAGTLQDYMKESAEIQVLHAEGVWNSLRSIRKIDSIRIYDSRKLVRDIADLYLNNLSERHFYYYGIRSKESPAVTFRRGATEDIKRMSDKELIDLALYVIDNEQYPSTEGNVDIGEVYKMFQVVNDLIDEKLTPLYFLDIDRLGLRNSIE